MSRNNRKNKRDSRLTKPTENIVKRFEIERVKTMTTKEIPYEWRDLTKRAVIGARATGRGLAYRWVAVMDTFAVGSTVAHNLCREFGLDPDEKVRR